ncbi:MAG: arsenate reductase family protein [Bacteroidota bacterium]
MRDRAAAGYIRALKSVKINEQDICNDMLTETQLVAATKKLGVEVKDLLQYDKKGDHDFTEEEALKLLRNQPSLLNTPFVLSAKKSFFIDTPLDLIKEQF